MERGRFTEAIWLEVFPLFEVSCVMQTTLDSAFIAWGLGPFQKQGRDSQNIVFQLSISSLPI